MSTGLLAGIKPQSFDTIFDEKALVGNKAKTYYKRTSDPIGMPPYLFEVNYEDKEFVIERDKQDMSYQQMTSKEVAAEIRDDLDNFLRRDSMYYNGEDFYIHENGDGNFMFGDSMTNWVIMVDKTGKFQVNWNFNPSTNFAYWVLHALDGMKIDRK
jgi:hypothetical protein